MPLRKIIDEGSTTPKDAQIMHDAYDAVLTGVMKMGLNGISSESIARKILDAAAQSSGTTSDRTGNQSTGGSGNQQPDSATKKSSGGQGG